MLDDIVLSKQQEIESAKQQLTMEDLEVHLREHLAERSFRKAIGGPGKLSLIAELKRKSPSKGMLRAKFEPVDLAKSLERAGASALSILTDAPFFGGRIEYIDDVKKFTEVPILRKDFIIDPYQIYESAFYGADAVLLIVSILTEEKLIACMQAADRLGLEPLVEVHSKEELKTALSVGAHVIGINHRDLGTLKIDPELSAKLVPLVPAGKIIVAESGIQTAQDVKRMKGLGVHAILVGEALMSAADPASKVQELFAGSW